MAPSAVGAGAVICDFCSLQADCTLDRELQLRDWCGEFVPALGFAPPIKGLEGRFSTFRGSSVWYDRAKVLWKGPKRFGLFNTETKERIGFATLTGAFRGPFHELMRTHALSNHLCRAKGMTDPKEAEEWLPRQIRNLAGSRYVKHPDQICTVIYLERING